MGIRFIEKFFHRDKGAEAPEPTPAIAPISSEQQRIGALESSLNAIKTKQVAQNVTVANLPHDRISSIVLDLSKPAVRTKMSPIFIRPAGPKVSNSSKPSKILPSEQTLKTQPISTLEKPLLDKAT